MPDYVSLSNVFIDDILLSTGEIFLGVLGGAGVHALAGARVWSKSLGLLASIGEDFNPEFLNTLELLCIDTSQLQIAQKKTTRAWQIFQPDEERVQVYRDKNNQIVQVDLESLDLSQSYRQAKGFHVHFSGGYQQLHSSMTKIYDQCAEVKIVFEPSTPELTWDKGKFKKILPLVDVFSPNELEAEAITKQSDPLEMIEVLISWGAEMVALRRGEKGSILAGKDLPVQYIPTVKTKIVDVTGAGNAYLGGMLVSLCEGTDVVEAALRGTVSASFAIEQFGVCRFNDTLAAERDKRFTDVQHRFHHEDHSEWRDNGC